MTILSVFDASFIQIILQQYQDTSFFNTINIAVANISFEASSQHLKFSEAVVQRCCNLKLKLLCNFIEITLWHEGSPANLLDIFKTPFPKITTDGSFWILEKNIFLARCSVSNTLKHYLCKKTISGISLLSRYIDFRVLGEYINFKIYDVIIDITYGCFLSITGSSKK